MKNWNRIVIAVVLGLVVVAAAAGLYFFFSGNPGQMRIGLVMPLSGEMGDEGRSILQAAQMAADEIRAAGVAGKPIDITIVPADDKGDDALAPKAAEELVNKGVSAVVGHLTSGTAIAAAPVYARAGIPELSATTHPRFTQLGLPTTFRLVANDDMQGRALARYAASQYKGYGFVVVDDGSVYGQGLAEKTASELAAAGQKVVLRKTYDAKADVFSEVTAAIERERARVVITTMELRQATLLMRQIVATRLGEEVVMLGGDSVKAGPVPAEAAQLRRFLATTPVTDLGEFGEAGKRFLDNYQRKYNRQLPAETAHYVYDAIHLLAQAAVAEKSTRGSVLTEALRKIDPTVPVTSYLRFRDDGELRFGAISVYAASKGEWRLVTRATEW